MAEEKVETIIVHSAVYKTEYTKKYRGRVKWEKPNDNHIYSVIPGTVVEVFVKPGDVVKQGDTLLIVEAMKMHNTVHMPVNGTIDVVHIKPGDKIPKKFLMMEIST